MFLLDKVSTSDIGYGQFSSDNVMFRTFSFWYPAKNLYVYASMKLRWIKWIYLEVSWIFPVHLKHNEPITRITML